MAAPTKSADFAGYELNFTSAVPKLALTTTLVVPKVKCGAAKTSLNVGVETYPASGGVAGVLLAVQCRHHKAHYLPTAFTANGAVTPGFAAHAGDKLVLSIKANSRVMFMSLIDKRSPKSDARIYGPGDASGYGDAQIGEFRASKAVPNFRTLTFTSSMLGGKPFGSDSPTGYDMTNPSTMAVQIATSAWTSHGTAFRTTYK